MSGFKDKNLINTLKGKFEARTNFNNLNFIINLYLNQVLYFDKYVFNLNTSATLSKVTNVTGTIGCSEIQRF